MPLIFRYTTQVGEIEISTAHAEVQTSVYFQKVWDAAEICRSRIQQCLKIILSLLSRISDINSYDRGSNLISLYNIFVNEIASEKHLCGSKPPKHQSKEITGAHVVHFSFQLSDLVGTNN